MWRKCDLHIHTTPNEQTAGQPLDAAALVHGCLSRGLSVIAITDHDHANNVEAVSSAAGSDLTVIAGVEISTNHGHCSHSHQVPTAQLQSRNLLNGRGSMRTLKRFST